MLGVNKVILLGNVGKAPDVVTFPSDGVVDIKKASFPLATNEMRRNRENEHLEVTEWHNVVCWRKLADLAEKRLQKGSQVFVEGRLQSRSWEDKEGNKRYVTEVVAESIIVLNGRQRSEEVRVDPLADLLNNDTEALGDLPF
ncbi:MAG: single-stranded DNA-binding protein [Bacteroidales bacterium]|nr:single-stranded DNA-binding protein [Bacteroidales bacterium]MBR1799465.1 single-stranded DNA-binding protein [Bacteroidales bacterium]